VNGCAGLHNAKTVEEIPQEDVVLAMKIKAKLIESKELNAAAINVEASNGLVKLSGFVETQSQRKLALSITQQIPNIKKVDNQIKVK
jgi:osmotically-inducible protein OsmY